MPDGVIRWIDPNTAEVGISRGGRTFVARFGDVASAARNVGQRVDFDIRRVGGAETAVRVQPRGGARTAPHHHNVGDLAGAHDAAAAAAARFERRHPEYGAGFEQHPLRVVSAWARLVAIGDSAEAIALYDPGGGLHMGNVSLVSPRNIRARLETLPVFGSGRLPAIRDDEGVVVARWDAPNPKEEATEARCVIRHGLIAEQWIGPPPFESGPSSVGTSYGPVALTTVTKGDVRPESVDYAAKKIEQVADNLEEPILAARIKLSKGADPANPRPAIAQASLDINGQIIRSQVSAPEMSEAIDLMVQRLNDQIEHRHERIQALRRHTPGVATIGEWRRADFSASRPDYYERPPEDRQLLRHKVFFADEQSVDEAIFDMELLGYDFYLFRDLAGGQDSLLERLPDGSYRLQRAHPEGHPATAVETVHLDTTTPPTLAFAEARGLLDATASRYLFFTDAASSRGCVLYRRYDGHYGLITVE